MINLRKVVPRSSPPIPDTIADVAMVQPGSALASGVRENFSPAHSEGTKTSRTKTKATVLVISEGESDRLAQLTKRPALDLAN